MNLRSPGRRPSFAAAALVLVLVLAGATPPAFADALDDALAEEGLTRADLGWQPRGYWSRYPADIPHKLRHFDDLLAQPLAVVTFTRTAAIAARNHLSPEALARVPEKSDGALYKAVQILGVDRKFGGFRNYSANLGAEPTDFVDAMLAVFESTGRNVHALKFGSADDSPDVRSELEEKAAAIPEAARPALGRLVQNLAGAHDWVERAFRNVSPSDRLAVQRLTGAAVGLTDALDYYPELDDAVAALDEASLWYGGLRAVAAVEQAKHDLDDLGKVSSFEFDWLSPLGWIRVRGGGNDEVDCDDSFLVVDLGGDDRHVGASAAPAAGRALSALLDLRGRDHYRSSSGAAQGAGLGGVGVLVDVAGDDRYEAAGCAQGFGQIGLGVLADLAGSDRYESRYSSQGASFLGVGLLLDAAGDDAYRIEADGQGFGGSGGVGTLADRTGDDHYEAIRDPAITGRPSYHSQMRISVSGAQGVGMGRRGDGGDGHSWAGGLGQLLDVEGDDTYVAGNWSQGTGYWFGTGLLHDGAGNDTYRGVVWSQGSGAHFCVGALVDEAGDDRHLIEEQGSASLAFGHDFSVSLLVNLGGNDVYEVPEGDGLGFSINRSVALFLDSGGDDIYRGKEGNRPGLARFDETFGNYDRPFTYFAEATSVGIFLDVGGTDTYDAGRGADDSEWLDEASSGNREVRNFSIGVDRAEGEIDLRPLPERAPSRVR